MDDIILELDSEKFDILKQQWDKLIEKQFTNPSGLSTVIIKIQDFECRVVLNNKNLYIIGFDNVHTGDYNYKNVNSFDFVIDNIAIINAVKQAAKQDNKSFWRSKDFLVLSLIVSEAARFEIVREYIANALAYNEDLTLLTKRRILTKYSVIQSVINNYDNIMSACINKYKADCKYERKTDCEIYNCKIIADKYKCDYTSPKCRRCKEFKRFKKLRLDITEQCKKCANLNYRMLTREECSEFIYSKVNLQDENKRPKTIEIYNFMRLGLIPDNLLGVYKNYTLYVDDTTKNY